MHRDRFTPRAAGWTTVDVHTPELRHAAILRYITDAEDHHQDLTGMIGCAATAFLQSIMSTMWSEATGLPVHALPKHITHQIDSLIRRSGFDVYGFQVLGEVAHLVELADHHLPLPADVEALRPKDEGD